MTENAQPENEGLGNDGQSFSKFRTNLQRLENAGLENKGPCQIELSAIYLLRSCHHRLRDSASHVLTTTG